MKTDRRVPSGRRIRSVGLRDALTNQFNDGQWHYTEEAVAKLGHMIPPEIAVRRYTASIEYKKTKETAERVLAGVDLETKIMRGRRIVIKDALRFVSAEARSGPGTRDRWAQFRIPEGLVRPRHQGESFENSVLTDEKVAEMFRVYIAGTPTHRELARRFGTHVSNISKIFQGKAWKHVPRPPEFYVKYNSSPRVSSGRLAARTRIATLEARKRKKLMTEVNAHGEGDACA